MMNLLKNEGVVEAGNGRRPFPPISL